ncbi:MAG: dephospho-CoA kinase [Firmicutes bacterium]|nr:dephospho-CoA kinase [Bacillota bacterium]
MKVIGLTGGIGSGKSTVSEYLIKKGYTVIDADAISRAATAPGGPALKPILLEFGAGVFKDDGTLDRKAMADMVFASREGRHRLEDIVCTIVKDEFMAQVEHLREEGHVGPVFFDAPLLFEMGLEKDMDECWLVTASVETRIRRVMKRDGLSREEILRRIDSQMSDDEKEKLADHVITNSLDLTWLYEQVDALLCIVGEA